MWLVRIGAVRAFIHPKAAFCHNPHPRQAAAPLRLRGGNYWQRGGASSTPTLVANVRVTSTEFFFTFNSILTSIYVCRRLASTGLFTKHISLMAFAILTRSYSEHRNIAFLFTKDKMRFYFHRSVCSRDVCNFIQYAFRYRFQ